jgi:hypothetical protein
VNARDAYEDIRQGALARIERRRLRVDTDGEDVRAEVEFAVDEYQRLAHLGEAVPLSDPHDMA